jgi:regulator of sigma E protease
MLPLAAGFLSVSSASALLKVALGFGLVIFIHELGHFLMARRNGVFVEKFAIGFDFFGLKLYSWRRGGTEYVIGALPLGGYVQMKGQADLPEEMEEAAGDPDSFQSKTVWQRTQIISAGVIANFLSAFALCWLAMIAGYHTYPAEVGSVSYATLEAGLRPGDKILEAGGKKVRSWEELVITYATQEPGSELPVRVLRGEQELTLQLEVDRDPRLPINYPDFSGPVDLRIGSYEMDSAADRAGVQPGDALVAVDGVRLESWAQFQMMIRQRADTDMTLTVGRAPGGTSPVDPETGLVLVELFAHPEARPSDEVPQYALGFEPEHPPVLDFVQEGSTGWQAGLRPGDRVAAVAGRPVSSWYGLWHEVTWNHGPADAVTLSVARGNEAPRPVSVARGSIPNWGLGTSALPSLGVAGRPPERLVVGELGPDAPSQLQQGDAIVAIQGNLEPLPGETDPREWGIENPEWFLLLALLNSLDEPRFEMEVERDGKQHSFTIELVAVPDPVMIGFLGVAPLTREILVRKGPVEAILPSLKAPFRILKEFFDGMRAMAMRRASTRMLAGPVGILQATYSYAEKSTGDLANFLALLSVNLAIVNFLPIPITDGGHFIFLMYEKVKGRRMEEELEARFQWAGLVFILLVFLFATFNDFGRIFGF